MALRIAKVIDNNSLNSADKKKNGRIQIFIYGLHSPVEDNANLPWAMCAQQDLEIPEINDLVIIDILDETNYKHIIYLGRIELPNLTDFDLFDTNVKPNVDGFSGEYPNVKYKYYNNGACFAMTSDTGEFLFYKNANTYFHINSSGEITQKSGTTTIEKSVLGETLKKTLEDLIDAISAITVICAAPGSASGVPVNLATFTAIKTTLSTILSAGVKHN